MSSPDGYPDGVAAVLLIKFANQEAEHINLTNILFNLHRYVYIYMYSYIHIYTHCILAFHCISFILELGNWAYFQSCVLQAKQFFDSVSDLPLSGDPHAVLSQESRHVQLLSDRRCNQRSYSVAQNRVQCGCKESLRVLRTSCLE